MGEALCTMGISVYCVVCLFLKMYRYSKSEMEVKILMGLGANLSRSQSGAELLQPLVVRHAALTHHQVAADTNALPGHVRDVELQRQPDSTQTQRSTLHLTCMRVSRVKKYRPGFVLYMQTKQTGVI